MNCGGPYAGRHPFARVSDDILFDEYRLLPSPRSTIAGQA
jgi:hypothetical protein